LEILGTQPPGNLRFNASRYWRGELLRRQWRHQDAWGRGDCQGKHPPKKFYCAICYLSFCVLHHWNANQDVVLGNYQIEEYRVVNYHYICVDRNSPYVFSISLSETLAIILVHAFTPKTSIIMPFSVRCTAISSPSFLCCSRSWIKHSRRKIGKTNHSLGISTLAIQKKKRVRPYLQSLQGRNYQQLTNQFLSSGDSLLLTPFETCATADDAAHKNTKFPKWILVPASSKNLLSLCIP
jgi:hypothetical protein